MIITPERAGEIRANLCAKHGATWMHFYHQAIEQEVLDHLAAAASSEGAQVTRLPADDTEGGEA